MELFPFQKYTIERFGPLHNVLLGDDMGLGKTAQAINLDLHRRANNVTKEKSTLVVAPLSMVPRWNEEFKLWAPQMKVMPINNKDRRPFLNSLENSEHDIYICHWPVLRLVPELADKKWFHIIADECHALQNRKAKQTLALKALRTDYKTGLSGTPAFDKPDDLWSVLNWLYPKHWSSYWKYFNNHVLFVEYNGYKQIIGVANKEKLQSEMESFYIRRRKEEVLTELPDKYNTVVEVELTPPQRRAYESMRRDMIAWVGEHEHEGVSASVVIAQLKRLLQFTCAFGDIEITKKNKVDKKTGESYVDSNENMILAEPSSKLDTLIEIINNSPANKQFVVFSQFAQVIRLLEKRLIKEDIAHGIYVGDVSAEKRHQIVEDFQASRLRVFAGTLDAGGVGITLTAADTVIFIDRSWSPSINRQAEDRLHRIGQTNAVHVIDLIAKNTIDAKRIQQIHQKWSWIRQLIGDDRALGDDWIVDK